MRFLLMQACSGTSEARELNTIAERVAKSGGTPLAVSKTAASWA